MLWVAPVCWNGGIGATGLGDRRGRARTEIAICGERVRRDVLQMPRTRPRKPVIRRVRDTTTDALKSPGTRPALRRYIVNTTFDATFVILGVVIGLAFSPDPDMRILLGTVLTSSVALAISTGVSVYEGESMEQSKRVKRIEEAMLTELQDTEVDRRSGASAALIAAVNFAMPLMVCGLLVIPFILLGEEGIRTAGYIAVGLALGILFVTGTALGRGDGRIAWLRGVRMALIGLAAFAICFTLESLI